MQCREACEVGARLDDPHRDLGRALERLTKRLVAVALSHFLATAEECQRILVHLCVGLDERPYPGEKRLRLPDRPACLLPVVLRGSTDHDYETCRHRDGDRGRRSSARGRLARERVYELA